MSTFIARRIGTGILTLLVVSILVFLLSRMTGNPVDAFLDPSTTAEDRTRLIASLGLDKPLHVQYYLFLENVVVRGDLGVSISLDRPVTEVFFGRFWNTIQLGVVSFLISVSIALPTGVLAAVHRATWLDWLARGFVFLGQALPNFWLGIMLILIFAVNLNLVAPAGKGDPSTLILILPNLANSIVILATLQIGTVVLMEAALSFLGVGLPPPTPAWGLMIAEGRDVLRKAWWVATMPGIALSLVILSANLAGDWVRDFLDPTMRHVQK